MEKEEQNNIEEEKKLSIISIFKKIGMVGFLLFLIKGLLWLLVPYFIIKF
ncbi:MAG: hypothetical protein NTW25_04485 [Candidatus Kapabacteria bacterium]|nr:hypothetical protein [Candidatus Kapabacteria bacterium]